MAEQPFGNAIRSPALQWPVLVKFFADPELACANTADECEQLLASGDGRTIVIDSAGAVFKSGDLLPQMVDLPELTQWVREHAMAYDQCCVAKIHVRSVADAISFIVQLEASQ